MDGATKRQNRTCKVPAKKNLPDTREPEACQKRHVLGWFRRIFPEAFFQTLKTDLGIHENIRVFSLPVTFWLMMVQRLSGGGLASAVAELVAGNGWDVVEPCKRAVEGTISLNTGGYSQARMRIPVEASRRVAQHTFDRLHEKQRDTGGLRRRLFLLDGSSIRLAHTAALKKRYGLGKNQNGESHWPVMRVVVMHHVVTGLAMAPEYGPMYGPGAVGEQELAEKLIGNLPPGAILIGDRNFGVFSVMWHAMRAGHQTLVRMTKPRANRIGKELRMNSDQRVTWSASDQESRKHSELPRNAAVEGRLITVQPEGAKEPLYLFTTLEEPMEEIVRLYKERWHIETDLRSLKEQVKLHQISAKTPDMAASELFLGVAAYNLIRAVMQEAAEQIGIEPRRLSYSRSQACFWAFTRSVSVDCSPERFEKQWKLLLRMLSQCKLPIRHRPPAPREVWRKPSPFPSRKSKPADKN